MTKVFCVIPAWNEEKNIDSVLSQVKPLVDQVVVVDDGSWDKTYEKAQVHQVVVLKHIINKGQGAALETGNQYSLLQGADIIVHFDADGQFLAQEIKDVIKPIKTSEAEVVFGSRFLQKKSDIPWTKKNLILPLASLVNKFLLQVTLSDPQSGFRAFSKNVASKIAIEQNGMAHCSEIIQKTFYHKLKVKEVSITVVYKDFGQSFSGGIRIIKDLILAKLTNY